MSSVRDGLVIPTSNVATIDPGTIETIDIDDVGIFIAAAARISRPLTSEAYVAGDEAMVVKSAPWSCMATLKVLRIAGEGACFKDNYDQYTNLTSYP